ncbi:MAG: flagellar basal body-associated FliL family protein [Polymorphobacter sp.]
MSDAPTDTKDKPTKPKGKGGGMVKSLLAVLVIIIGAAAGGFGGVVGAAKLGLVGGGGGGHAVPAPAPHGPVEYVEIDNAFTSNLVDTGRYLQLRISVSTTGGADVVAAIQQHKPALISMVLAVLGE